MNLAGVVTILLAFAPPPAGDHRAPGDPVGADVASIPLIDLAHETERPVIIDREPGAYLGHPTTVLLDDGQTIIAVYPRGHGRGPILMKRSADGGRTWSDRLPTPDNWATSLETPTIHRVIDPRDGARRLILFSGLHPIRMARSDDDGLNWTPLEPIGDFGGIVAMSSVERLRDGRYLATFHDDGRYFRAGGSATGTFTVFQVRSSDGGLTWNEPESIWSGADVHLCEGGMVRSPDGVRLGMLLRENRRVTGSQLMTSDDEGTTWSPPRELPATLTGDRHVARHAPDGRLLVTFRDMATGSPTKGDWVAWIGTFDDLIAGRDGAYRARLMDSHHPWDAAYPAIEVLPDGTFVATTYGHWIEGEPPFVVCLRFTLEELDERLNRQANTP